MIVIILWAVILFAITIAIDPYYPIILAVAIAIVGAVWTAIKVIKHLIKI